MMEDRTRKESLGLVSCTKSKRRYRCRAVEMYSASPLFRMAYAYASGNYSHVGILSTRYGFLLPDDEIDTYDATLKAIRVGERIKWAQMVAEQIEKRDVLCPVRTVYFHAGVEYREFLIPKLESLGKVCCVPLAGLGLGRQLAWYKAHLR